MNSNGINFQHLTKQPTHCCNLAHFESTDDNQLYSKQYPSHINDLKNQALFGNRSNSLPNSLSTNSDSDNCDTDEQKLLNCVNTNPNESSDIWFNTWPERCDKSREDVNKNSAKVASSAEHASNNNVLSLEKALQNISLAYNPITKQLELINEVQSNVSISEEQTELPQGDNKSISSNISNLSSLSCNGSLLGVEEKLSCESAVDESLKKTKITGLFARGLQRAGSWFYKNKSYGNYSDFVVSSNALIQHKRPPNLPAKDKSEEQKHDEEYRAILEAARKKQTKENINKLKRYKAQAALERQISSHTQYWNTVILNWEAMSIKKRTQDLWWLGIPPSVRGKVWRFAIGNVLNLAPSHYQCYVAEAELAGSGSRLESIRMDIARTFPTLGVFQEGGPFWGVLSSLLAAYVCYRPEVGYVQGMSFIGAVFVLNMDPTDAFISFANFLERPLLRAAFGLDEANMAAYCAVYDSLFLHNLPRLHKHFNTCALTPDLYLFDWLYTVFARAMPLDVACRVWDVYLRDGDEFIFKSALGVLRLHQELLLDMDFIHGAQFLTRLPEDLDSDSLFRSIQSIQVNTSKQTFSQLLEASGVISA